MIWSKINTVWSWSCLCISKYNIRLLDITIRECYYILNSYMHSSRPGSCISELQLKVNCRPEVNCRIIFWLARPIVERPDQIFSYNSLSINNSLSIYNSLSATIHLYMIRPQMRKLNNIAIMIKFHNRII